jgi:hypothetical protein
MTAKWIVRYYYKYSIVVGVIKQVWKVLNDVPLAPQKQISEKAQLALLSPEVVNKAGLYYVKF